RHRPIEPRSTLGRFSEPHTARVYTAATQGCRVGPPGRTDSPRWRRLGGGRKGCPRVSEIEVTGTASVTWHHVVVRCGGQKRRASPQHRRSGCCLPVLLVFDHFEAAPIVGTARWRPELRAVVLNPLGVGCAGRN